MLKDPLFTAGDEKIKEVARVENNSNSLCPVCNSQMHVTQACGIPTYVCLAHRIVMPMED